MAYIVRVTDEEQGYADERVMGGFRTLTAARAFADRVSARIQNPDQFSVYVNRVMPPRLGPLEDEGWFEDP
jgi:hypothetical protein